MPSDCSDASEEEAEQICSKHLPHEASTGSEAGRRKFGVSSLITLRYCEVCSLGCSWVNLDFGVIWAF